MVKKVKYMNIYQYSLIWRWDNWKTKIISYTWTGLSLATLFFLYLPLVESWSTCPNPLVWCKGVVLCNIFTWIYGRLAYVVRWKNETKLGAILVKFIGQKLLDISFIQKVSKGYMLWEANFHIALIKGVYCLVCCARS